MRYQLALPIYLFALGILRLKPYIVLLRTLHLSPLVEQRRYIYFCSLYGKLSQRNSEMTPKWKKISESRGSAQIMICAVATLGSFQNVAEDRCQERSHSARREYRFVYNPSFLRYSVLYLALDVVVLSAASIYHGYHDSSSSLGHWRDKWVLIAPGVAMSNHRVLFSS